ncbi:hypothetical protein T439DRAFT_322346 [Meredithblackwellia eburnea MCA 4105]
MPFGPTHPSLRALAKAATQAFFSRVLVEGHDEVPSEGPVIVVANHWNAAVDPAMLSCWFPHNRKLHYWAKSTLFKPGFARTILLDAGNLPVDRRNKDNQKLFASTFDALKYGECVAIFPEGGSYTVPGMKDFKDGASWAALEYAKNIRTTGKVLSEGGEVKEDPKDVTICIAGISYTDKSKYRSCAVMQFGASISITPFIEEFMNPPDGDPKTAVKKLTKAIHEALLKVTVNAPDWTVLNAANMARKMLWVDQGSIPLDKLRDIGQTLVDLFTFPTPSSPNASSTSSDTPQASDDKLSSLRTLLVEYHASLRSTSLSHYTLSGVPLPSTLDPSIPHPLPTRFRVAFHLFTDTLSSLLRLPFFILPLIVHLPIYLIGKFSLRFSDLEEDAAQNKIALGLVLAIMTYPVLVLGAWWLLFGTRLGGVMAIGFGWVVAVYHNTLIDDNYNAAKRLMASWRVLVGIWAPHATSTAADRLRSLNSDLASGVADKIDVVGENEVRRVLRLRVEVMKILGEYLESRRGEEGGHGLVEKLEEWGAKVPKVVVVGTTTGNRKTEILKGSPKLD